MDGYTDALRGDGLAKAQRALMGFEEDPLRLSNSRKRFSRSPPPCMSDESGTTTRSASPDLVNEEQRQYNQRQAQLGLEADASLPREQFNDQIEEEMRRVWMADSRTSWIDQMPIEGPLEENARETVKKRWIEQGIWNKRWNQFASGRWKHEEPLELESRLGKDSEAGLSAHNFSFSPKESHPKPRRPTSDEEKRLIAEQRVVQEREHEASRPYHQFVYQISKERERIQDVSTSKEGAGTSIADINTRAYENVKNIWTKRGIWNRRWGILPGMSWKHEEPLEEEEVADNPALVQANPLVNESHQVGKAPPSRIFGPPSPVDSNYLQVTTSIDSARLENGDADHSPSASNSPRPRMGKLAHRPTTRQALRRSSKIPLPEYKQSQPAVIASFGPVYSSKVSKAAGNKKPNPQQELNILQRISSGDLPLSSSVDSAVPRSSADHVTPRRSKRINPPLPSVAKDITRTSSIKLIKQAVRSKPERNVVDNLAARSSAKPQGISKRQPAKTTKRKAKNQ